MSYSFSVKASNKKAAKEAVKQYFDEKVVPGQPVHARDRAAVFANADAAIDMLADDETKDVAVSVNGWVTWTDPYAKQDAAQFSGVSICASAGHANRE